jgi:phosphatidylserine/phosphatidylglycerophosphate/cardiolipin synthase-like enzyme
MNMISPMLTLLAALVLAVVPSGSALAQAQLSLVETSPVETTLDHPDIPEAHQVWVEMIAGSEQRLDLAQFYISDQAGGRLEPVLDAIRAAAKRGVQVRILADAKFHRTYPETLDALAKKRNIEVVIFDVEAHMGGVLHAKYFLVDGREAYLGSQNFDWRSLEHVQELGVRTDQPELVRGLVDIFEADWALAGGTPREQAFAPPAEPYAFPVTISLEGGDVHATLAASPTGWLPDEQLWDLPQLVALIDGAQERVRIQLLNYKTSDYQGRYFDELDAAIRRAAARKVHVEILVADWSMKRWTIEGLQSLQCMPRIEVKLVTIPEHSAGFIPFARVVHAKYLVVDGERAWLGTSNWGRDYFHASRNVGLVVDGAVFASQLDGFFEDLWSSEYALTVDPGASYEAPRTK